MYCNIKFFKTRIVVSSYFCGFCVSDFLKTLLGLPYTSFQTYIHNSLYINDSKVVTFLQKNVFVRANDVVVFRIYKVTSIHIPIFNFIDVIHETRQRIVVNKNANTIVYFVSKTESNTLFNFLLYLYPELYNIPQCGLLHRLDKSTTGLIVIARTIFFYYNFLENARNYVGCKIYNAVLLGKISEIGYIIAPISKQSSSSVNVTTIGKYSTTFFSIKRIFFTHTYVCIYLGTGRKHQIRAHFSFAGVPIFGDYVYCKKTQINVICNNKRRDVAFISKPVLTARQFVIKDCNGRFVTFTSRVSYFIKFLL